MQLNGFRNWFFTSEDLRFHEVEPGLGATGENVAHFERVFLQVVR